jgi:iron complex transport system substrate-binding protein
VVGVTHECDYPPEATSLPQLTATVLPEGLDAGEIDAAVKEVVGEGRALYSLDEERLAELAPDLIVTQAVCEVCAVSYEDVVKVAARLPGQPRAVQQDPSTLGDVLEDVTRLDPPFLGGHWVPEMIEIAGGIDVAGKAGQKSPQVEWEQLATLEPDIVVAMPCGWYLDDSIAQARAHRERFKSLGARQVFAVDAASSFSRPGPRLVDGVELLAHIFHPPQQNQAGERLGFPAIPLLGHNALRI